jgi:hypothetical protein
MKRIDVNTRLLRDSTPMLEIYFAFPFNVENPHFRFEASNAVIEPIIDQLPGSNTDSYAVQHWVEVFNENRGVAWTSLDAPMTEFGGLWPGYVSGAHHGVIPSDYGHPFLKPGELSRGHLYSLAMYNNFRTNFVNVHPGEALFRYSFTTHSGDWQAARAWQSGWSAMNPPQVVWMKGPKAGPLGPAASFVQVDAPNILLVTVKKAEDGDGMVFRLVEVQGKETEVTLSLPFFSIQNASLADPVEEKGRELPHRDHEVQAGLKPFEVVTLRVRLTAFSR